MAFPIYTTEPHSDQERGVRLLARRRALPERMRLFPDPPPYLSAVELEIWNDIRGAFSGTGAVGSDQFAAIEGLVCELASGAQLRAAMNNIPVQCRRRRRPLIDAIEASDASILRWLDFLCPTRAMRVYLATRSGVLTMDRVGLARGRA